MKSILAVALARYRTTAAGKPPPGSPPAEWVPMKEWEIGKAIDERNEPEKKREGSPA